MFKSSAVAVVVDQQIINMSDIAKTALDRHDRLLDMVLGYADYLLFVELRSTRGIDKLIHSSKVEINCSRVRTARGSYTLLLVNVAIVIHILILS